MSDKPSQALRRGEGRACGSRIEAVQKGEADVAVSAGNTGAFMAMAKLILRPMAGIERPAIAAHVADGQGGMHRARCRRQHRRHRAPARRLRADGRGDGARALPRRAADASALLNIGVEEIKGVEEVRQAHAWLKSTDLPLDYRGFIEGDQIGQGVVDVVVVEGFAGNIALKTAEGTARQIGEYLKAAMRRTWLSRLGAVAGRRRLPRPEGKDGPAAGQRRHVPRPQRHRGQEPRGHGCARLCQRRRSRRTRWPKVGSRRGWPPIWRRSIASSRR